MNQILDRWTPPSNVRDHTGDPIASDARFFAPPPIEIGAVLTAHSGLCGSVWAVSKPTSRKVIGLFALLGMAFGGFLGAAFTNGSVIGAILGSLLGGYLFGFLLYRREARKNDCTYTGTLGIARCRFTDRTSHTTQGEVFLFADAMTLQTAFLGRKGGTNFDLRWKNANRKLVYRIEGGYYGSQANPDPESVYHFVLAADSAWSQFILPEAEEELKRNGCVRFTTSFGPIGEQNAVIGPGYIDIIKAGKTMRNLTADIQDACIWQGHIIIRRKDARVSAMGARDGSNGIFYLSYGAIMNVKIFLLMLERLVGISCR